MIIICFDRPPVLHFEIIILPKIFRDLDLGNAGAAVAPIAPGADIDEADEQQPMEIDGIGAKTAANDLSFQLEPIEQQHQQRERVRHKRKRKLVVDDQKVISGDEMKANMADYRYSIL